jgi:glutathione S-transferase
MPARKGYSAGIAHDLMKPPASLDKEKGKLMTAFAYPLTGLVTVISIMVYIWMMMKVGNARRLHNTPAPAIVGPEAFNRVMRVHGNTLEGLAMFLPALWLAALTSHDLWAAIVGIFFPIGRVIYAQGYYQAADKRGTGFMISSIATLILLLASLVFLIRIALASIV